MRLTDASFVVTDTETTGMRAGVDHLIEIAAVRVRGGVVVERFQQLIDPRVPIPGRITRLTGITNAMVAGRPTLEEVMARYCEFLAGGVLVAHNLTFDLRFMNAAMRACGRPELSAHTLCTLRLARRLLPGLRSKSLGSVCDFFRIRNERAHRALGDAEATARILLRFLEMLGRDHGIETVEQLHSFQRRPYRSSLRSPHLARIKKTILPSIPSAPGVYFMRDGSANTIYIGKARDLRARVSSYFSGIEGHPPRLRKMLDVVREVVWEETTSELDAMLLESRLIKEQQPRFNRAQRRYRVHPFLRISVQEPFPSVSMVPVLKRDGSRYFGPLESREQAERIRRVVDRFFLLRTCSPDTFAQGRPCDEARAGRCCAPCGGFVSADGYRDEMERVMRFLDGEEPEILESIRQAMRAASVAMDYETAADLRDSLHLLEGLLERQGAIAPSVLAQNAVIAHVADDASDRGALQLHLIRSGRLHDSLRLPSGLASVDRDDLARRLAEYFHPDCSLRNRYDHEETDEVRLIRQWAYMNREQIERIPWSEDADRSALMCQVLDAVERLAKVS